MKKNQRAVIWFGIILCGLSIFFVIKSFMVQHNTRMLYPIVLPCLILVLALMQLRRRS